MRSRLVCGLIASVTLSAAAQDPVIISHPESRVLCAGSMHTLSITATGCVDHYEWYRNGDPLGVNSPDLFLVGGPTDEGMYQAQAVCLSPYSVAWSEYALVSVQDLGEALVNAAALPPVITPTPRVPLEWRAPDFQWVRDVSPYNKIDDEIDDPGAIGPFDVIVNFRKQITPGMLADVSAYGAVELVGRLLPSVFMDSVDFAGVQAIASRVDVAFIELQRTPEFLIDVATQTTRVSSGFYSPCTVQDQFGTEGRGVNIAIMDSGVDDPGGFGVTHNGLPPAMFYYDAYHLTFSNPDDGIGHGTQVAYIAMGRGGPLVPPGVAKSAGLIDVAISNVLGQMTSNARIYYALEVLIYNRINWNVGVINMSFSWPGPSDGSEAYSQLVNLADSHGITVVAAAGNNGVAGPMGYPASAAGAITVANSNDMSTPFVDDDVLSATSTRGPRAAGLFEACLARFKPDIAAPGSQIYTARHNSADDGITVSGTSMSAPHVAGIAAMMRGGGAWIHWSPYTLPSFLVRKILIDTAERRGVPYDPSCDPDWDNGWGWGLVNAHLSVMEVALFSMFGCLMPDTPTDVGFLISPTPAWGSGEIGFAMPPQAGQLNFITATVSNFGPVDAHNMEVRFEAHDVAAGNPAYQVIGVKRLLHLPSGVTMDVTIPWTPPTPGQWSVKAFISYAFDLDTSNNVVQRSIAVAQSPASFLVCNHVSQSPIQIEFLATAQTPGSLWGIQFDPPTINLGPGECATIQALPLPPFGAPDGEQERIWVSAWTDNGCLLLGGVGVDARMTDCNANGIDDWFDIRDGFSQDQNGNGVPDSCECMGDVTGDGSVGLGDLVAVLIHFMGDGTPSPGGDADGDGDTDLADLLMVLMNFGCGV